MRPIEILFIVALAFSLNMTSASASEEEFAKWKTVKIEFTSLGQASPSSLEIYSGKSGIERFLLNTFGKTFSLTESDLAKIRKFPLQDLKVTHEAGYEKAGGYSVHVMLHRADSSSRQENAIVTFQKNSVPKVTIRSGYP